MMIEVICMYCGSFIRLIFKGDGCRSGQSHGVCETCLPCLLRDLGMPLSEFLDSLAAPVLLVAQDDARIVAANSAAQKMLSKPLSRITGDLGGNVLCCVHANKPGGCGKTLHCRSCVIRRTVMLTMETGEPCCQVSAGAEVSSVSGSAKVEFLISTEKREGFVLLRIDKMKGSVAAPPAVAG